MTIDENLDWLYRLRSEIYVYMPKEWLFPMYNAIETAIIALEQEPKTGHWEYWESFDPTYDGDIYKCSICKCTANVPTVLGIPMFKYCPNCGARMESEEE